MGRKYRGFSFALVLYGFVLIFQDVGIGAFIIKEQNISDCQVRAASHLAIIFGVITFFVFIIVIQFFNKGDSFQYICYAISLNFPILGLSIVNKAMLEKIGDFSKIGKLGSLFVCSIRDSQFNIAILYKWCIFSSCTWFGEKYNKYFRVCVFISN